MKKHPYQLIIIYVFFLFVLYILPSGSSLQLHKREFLNIRLDYFLHATLFLPIPVLLGKYVKDHQLYAIILLISCAITMELLHLIVPDRSFNLFDMLANVTGIFIGLIATYTINHFRKQKQSDIN